MKALLTGIFLSGLAVFGFAKVNTQCNGTVEDKITGQPVEGAVVILKNKANNHVFKTMTAANGKFIFPNIKAGNYETIVNFLDYNKKQKDILVKSGAENRLDLKVSLSAYAEIKEISPIK
ncbi:carboxypeptidase-like regulatory domain-containing protein [Pinibacter soli]|uniref:Carboxypeptidase-like regulatory domain-containing protein n=1 Tax=Pinibacter soli TaxID=3044211 RepID=A0ABT6R9X2_9BACT|nr:carboxypeptidase-like regulatory domain-containing protein [Pinibacter soli]MDI3319340.1 carboxypeptidase-like regulatory domain-containing protein [Pinibacter soli]